MPIIYTDSMIRANTMQQTGNNTSAYTKGLVVTNYSDYVMNISIVSTSVSAIIPPYSQIKIPIASNTSWSISAANIAAAAIIPNLTMYVSFDESFVDLEPGIISLAQLPAYNMNVTGSFNLTGTNNNVNIGNTPNVVISGTANMNVVNTPSMNIASGNVNATIQNATLNSQIVNTQLSTNELVYMGQNTFPVTNFANAATLGAGDISGRAGYYSKILIQIHSAAGKQYTVLPNQTGILQNSAGGVDNKIPYCFVSPGVTYPAVEYRGSAGDGYTIGTLQFPQCFNDVSSLIQNNTGANIVSDTVTITVYAIQESTSITPATSKAVAQTLIAGTGTISQLVPSNVAEQLHKVIISLYNPTPNVTPATAYFRLVDGNGTTIIEIPVQNLAASSSLQPVTLDLSPGIANIGLGVMYFNPAAGAKDIYVTLFIVK